MKHFLSKAIAVAFTSIVFPTLSFGDVTLVSADWKNQGDGLITYDTSSGLDWLDLTETTNMSFNFVTTQLDEGGIFDGWRYANEAEVLGLFDSAGFIMPHYTEFESTPEQVNAVKTLISLMGETGVPFGGESNPERRGSQFFFHDEDYNPEQDPLTWQSQAIFEYEDRGLPEFPRYADLSTTRLMARPDNGFDSSSSGLVRQHVANQVPLPASGWLFISMISSLAILRRKSKSCR